ncbi:MAG: AAA family ATPase [Blastocatellia bacterium]
MFLTADQIRDSIEHLESVHPFFGITFLACKQARLPVGKPTEFYMDSVTKDFLDTYFKPDPDSEWYFRVFRLSDKSQEWLRPDYASSGLQAINTQTFGKAFIHRKNINRWAWAEDYVDILRTHLKKKQRIPAFNLAAWLYRDRNWPARTTEKTLVDVFLDEFNISGDEKKRLFDLSTPIKYFGYLFLQDEKVSWDELNLAGPPPDATPEEGGTLSFLQVQGVGPAKSFKFEPSERLNLITGDNGLGKTFLLDCAWWALTGDWAGRQAYPRQEHENRNPQISFQIKGARKYDPITIKYDWIKNNWPPPESRPTIPGLVVYARVDGSFSVWDPALKYQSSQPQSLTLTREEIWRGVDDKIEGLLRDWVRWQITPDKSPFEVFKRVLRRLSPPDMGVLEPAESRRIPGERREIPHLKHPYGEVPILVESAGVRRIITLAYLIVWAWTEHKIASELAHQEPQSRMVILIDEMEAHLHPKSQRAVLPALLDVKDELSSKLQIQSIVATHSPLVMASVEPIFNKERDRLFHLDLTKKGQVTFNELPFVAYGAVDSWLTSQVFELEQPRNRDAERAIEAAIALQKQKSTSKEEVQRVTDALVRYVPAEDEFWPRWVYFAEQYGIEI